MKQVICDKCKSVIKLEDPQAILKLSNKGDDRGKIHSISIYHDHVERNLCVDCYAALMLWLCMEN